MPLCPECGHLWASTRSTEPDGSRTVDKRFVQNVAYDLWFSLDCGLLDNACGLYLAARDDATRTALYRTLDYAQGVALKKAMNERGYLYDDHNEVREGEGD